MEPVYVGPHGGAYAVCGSLDGIVCGFYVHPDPGSAPVALGKSGYGVLREIVLQIVGYGQLGAEVEPLPDAVSQQSDGCRVAPAVQAAVGNLRREGEEQTAGLQAVESGPM
jgi:hypothetical protein